MDRFYNPVRTVYGEGGFYCLPEILREMGMEQRRVLVLAWGEQVFSHPVFEKLKDYDVKIRLFTASNPTVEQLFSVYQETKEFSPEVVVAVGGGSVMDVGKSLCCMYQKELDHADELRTLIREKTFGIPKARWIGVPTTSGTGSEVTCWATIWDPEKNAKLSVENHKNYGYAALVDPRLTKGMPLSLAASSALDAVAHAAEAYWAKGTNGVSRGLALQAIRIIMEYMEDLLEGKNGAEGPVAQGSMLAGLAFSNTKTTACHSISYPLTMGFGIPHGAAVSMLLAPVLKLNASETKGMEMLLAALGVESAEALNQRIKDFLKRSGQPDTLKGWGVPFEECASLAELGMTKGRADNNPVELTVEIIKEILESIYE